jgi:DNA repair protein RadC
MGTSSHINVHPRDVFREAIRWNANAVIVAHNHPCGNPIPSEEDIQLTANLIKVARVHSIPLLDHLVLGSPDSANGKGYVSIRNLAIMEFG